MQFLQKEIQIVLLDISRRYCLFSDKSHYENYVLPAGWQYATMGEICSKIVDGDHNPPPGQPNPTKFVMVSSKNIANDKICNITDVRYLTEQDFYCAHKRTYVEKGDILFTSVASLGRTCIYSLEEPVTFQRSVTVINTLIYNKYLKLFLDSPIYQNYVNDNARGTAQKGFYINQISDSLVPIPPLSEQIRLATKVEELLNTVCQLELLKDDLGNNIKKIKSTILDMAIIGRLIPQNPSDEPAIQLIRTINPDFRSTDNRHYENVPYKVPETWQWVKLKDLCVFLSRGKSPVYSETDKRYPVFAQKCNLKEGGISLKEARFLEPRTISKWKDVYKLQDGDILVNSTGTGTVCRTRLFRSEYLCDYPFVVPDSHVSVIRTDRLISSEYAYLVLVSKFSQTYMMDNLAGSTNQKELYISVLENLLFPLPPADEQKRIVKCVNEIYMQLEQISSEL